MDCRSAWDVRGQTTIKGERRHLPPLPDPKSRFNRPLPVPPLFFPFDIVASTTPHDLSPIKDWAFALVAKNSWLAPSLCMSQILGKVFSKGIEGIPAVKARKERLIKLFSSLF
jgi:hypothetical protein